MRNYPLLLHIPHSSEYIPQEVREKILLSDSELNNELLRMTDRYTDILFDLSKVGAQSIIYPVSRLVVDPERFEDDNEEPMAKIGMGVIYTSTSFNRTLREQPDETERIELLESYYRQHHRRFTEKVDSLLRDAGHALIIDCHSFPSKPWPYELNQDKDRPDICIGTDFFHTPVEMLEVMRARFEELGYSVYVNRPFGGAIVPFKYYNNDKRVKSIMIEVNRKLYMDENTGIKQENFSIVKTDLETVLTQLCEVF